MVLADTAHPTVLVAPDTVTIARGPLMVEIALRPFSLTVRRAGRRVLRSAGAWTADGTVADHFIGLTEGVIPAENLTPMQRATRAEPVEVADTGVTLNLRFGDGERRGTLQVDLPAQEKVHLILTPSAPSAGEPSPARIAIDWDRRTIEHFHGLGVRHHPEFDHRGRRIQLGADRRYTGPDCPPEMLAGGGIPQGDCAPTPWLESSRGYAVLCRTAANGTVFDTSSDRTAVSTRAHAGPLTLEVYTRPTPAARLRAMCTDHGFPMLLPEWAYGFWKSRDVHEDREAVLDDFHGFRRYEIPVDAIVIDSPWATQYNTWDFNPHQFPDAEGMVQLMREDGVRTVVWCTPWVNLDSRDGQIPPQPESARLHEQPAANYESGVQANAFVTRGGEPWVGQWWMGTGSLVDFTSDGAEAWWREQVERILRLGVEGIKMDDGDGFYVPDDADFADGRTGAEVAWENGSLHRLSLQRALDAVHPETGVLFGRSGWTGQHATGFTWGADQASDFWSLRVLVVATLQAAMSGYSNWSHDVGGYLGHRLTERCPPELLHRWLQFGCFTPLMQAHSRMAHEPWNYGEDMTDAYRGYVLLHEMLVPYVRAAAATAARAGLPIIRPLPLLDPADERGHAVGDAYGYGPSLWVAPVLDDGAREREVVIPRGDWIATWSREREAGGDERVVPTPLERIPVWVRAGSIITTHPAASVARGLADEPEADRPIDATLWGRPACGRAAARLADGTVIAWRAAGGWSVRGGPGGPPREVSFRVIDA